MNDAKNKCKIGKVPMGKKFPQFQFRLYIASNASGNYKENQQKACYVFEVPFHEIRVYLWYESL